MNQGLPRPMNSVRLASPLPVERAFFVPEARGVGLA